METFIKKAIEGGWRPSNWNEGVLKKYPRITPDGLNLISNDVEIGIHKTLLDPEAWKAVGKVEGWDKELTTTSKDTRGLSQLVSDSWLHKMHNMIDHLAQGKDIESYISGLF